MFHLDEQYENILAENDVKVICNFTICIGSDRKLYPGGHCWCLDWKHGGIDLGPVENEITAKKSAAIFIYLWLKDISSEFALECARDFAYVKTLERIVKELRDEK